MSTWELIDAERTSWADLADSLAPDQWDAQSLCSAWKVRDVVAHVTQGANITAGKGIATMLKYGFRMNRMLEREAVKDGGKPSDELREELRETIGGRRTPPGAKPEDVLLDLIVHEQDVRRPLRITTTIPPEALTSVLDRLAKTNNPLMPARKRAGGLHLRATDTGWEHGTGDDVSGPAEAVLLALAGRAAALNDLSGPGVELLRTRLAGS
jgi:uncharacterized protein (TIGR03083 family)